VLSGTVTPFDTEALHELYSNHGTYVNQYVRATNDVRMQGFLLPEDASMLKMNAAMSNIGLKCGLGFELVAIVPLILWLSERRRQRRGTRTLTDHA
jgi:hypothetical protein